MNWPLIISVISVFLTALSTLSSWRSRKSAKAADARAERSAAAAERSAQAAEAHVETNTALFEAGKVRIVYEKDYSNTEPRSLRNSDNSGFLVNHGTHNAYDVHWDAPKILMESRVKRIPVLSPGIHLPIFLAIPYMEFDTRVNVHYRREPSGTIETVQLVL